MLSTEGRILSVRRSALVLAAAALLMAAALSIEVTLVFDEDQAHEASSGSHRSFEVPDLPPPVIWPDASKIVGDGRTLFMPKAGAAPIPPPPEPPPAQPQEQFSLVAILIAPAGKFVLLRGQQTQGLQQAQEGSMVGSWNLAVVEANRVILERASQRTILYLPDTVPENP
jgi:hypothetical protein